MRTSARAMFNFVAALLAAGSIFVFSLLLTTLLAPYRAWLYGKYVFRSLIER